MLEKAIHSQLGIDLSKLLVYSDQGSQYTSKEFTEFCENLSITQSMSKARHPYDNAPTERYFNTLKMLLFTSIITAQRKNSTQQSKNLRMYNIIMYIRISYNNYKTPYAARYGIT